jgi:threonylcarbamoyladenosine tRNA methylthiotransferase MtaB
MGCNTVDDRQKAVEGGYADLVLSHSQANELCALVGQALQERRAGQGRGAAPVEGDFKPDSPDDSPHDFTLDGSARFAERTRANLKIQDGCSCFCTYCIVPYTRGLPRNGDFEDALREARELVEAGYKELVICGVNLMTYSSHGYDLADLLEEILKIGPGFRIRIGSAEPGPQVERVVAVMKKRPRICRFLHLPLQSGDDTILERMGRSYKAAEYAEMARNASLEVPGLCLGADVITGFPGETEELFANTRRFIDGLPFGLLHIFPYSPRPGTPAASFKEKVPHAIAAERATQLIALGEAKAHSFATSQLGKHLEILVEHDGAGWTDNYLHATLSQPIPQNTLVTAKIIKVNAKREVLADAVL